MSDVEQTQDETDTPVTDAALAVLQDEIAESDATEDDLNEVSEFVKGLTEALSEGEAVTSGTEATFANDEANQSNEPLTFDFPTLTKPRIAIVGFALGTVHKAPYQDDEVEKWGINQLWKVAQDKHFDRWFELHSLYDFYHSNPGHQQFLREFEGPVYVREEDYQLALKWGIKNAVPFPHRIILENFRPYFTNTISWLLALAIMMHPEWMGVYGVDMAQDNILTAEYSEQRPSCEYFLGIAEGLGIDLDIPNGCDLLGSSHLYGYEDSGRILEKMGARYVELNTHKAQMAAQIQQLDSQTAQLRGTMAQMDGAMAETTYYKKNWLTKNAEPERE